MGRFEMDIRRFLRDFNHVSTTVLGNALETGLNDVMDEWKRESTDVAPLKKGTLRRSIKAELEGGGLEREGVIIANATERWKRGRFNYAYYIHNVKEEIKFPSTPGTIAKFLDKPAEDNEKRWMNILERTLQQEVKRAGW